MILHMANIRIADLPTTTTVNEDSFLAIDSYELTGTEKVTPKNLITPIATPIATQVATDVATPIAQDVAQDAVDALITIAELEQLQQRLSVATSKLFDELDAIIDRVDVDYIVEQGETGDWVWRKWNSGRYEAERVHNIGQYTISTNVSTGVMCGATVNFQTPPHTLVSGNVQVSYISNSSNSGIWIEPVSPTQWRICKAISTNVALQNVTVAYRVVAGKWK